jgi:hypothetical protein
MNRILALMVALGSLAVLADDVKTVETKTTVKKNKDGSAVTLEKKTTKDPAGMFNSTTDTDTRSVAASASDAGTAVKTEHVMMHDAPGMKHDKQVTKSVEVVRDAKGNVIKEETKAEVK